MSTSTPAQDVRHESVAATGTTSYGGPRPGWALRRRRQDAALLVLATALGLWLGLGAPDVSPVAPVLAGVAVLPTLTAPAPPADDAPAPDLTVPPRTRGGRR